MMNKFFVYGLIAGTVFAGVNSGNVAVAQQSLPELEVEDRYPDLLLLQPDPHSMIIRPGGKTEKMYKDGGDFLKNQPGISAGRIGGHGTEPVIHGQQQTQLNIVNDGVVINGGCPNRMDPPSSFVDPETYDEITVLRGYQSVTHGAGGTGGTIIFKRNPLPFDKDYMEFAGKAGVAYESNGNLRKGYADIAAGSSYFQIRATGAAARADNYEDGNGTEVRSAYKSRAFSLEPVWTPTENTRIALGVNYERTDDLLFAGTRMDSPKGDDIAYKINVEHSFENAGVFEAIAFDAYSSQVDHLMDNFTLRDNTGTKMKTPTESDSFGGNLSGNFRLFDVPFTVGFNMRGNNRDAKRYSGAASATDATNPQSYMWPDARLVQSGVFVQAKPSIGEKTHLIAGIRYDHVEAEADAADQVFGSASPNSLYQQHYGIRAKKVREDNIGGLLRLEYDLDESTSLFAGLSRSLRTADATERFLAANSGVASMRWIGNPGLDPEKHHQIDVGVMKTHENWDISLSGYYDDVSDFIMRDRARGQSGIVANSNETIYRNIDATLTGGDVLVSYRLTPEIEVVSDVSYTYGNNDTDDDALAQIAPIEGSLSLTYGDDEGGWSLGTRMNFAAKQSRIDDDTSMRDVQETGGWATFDVYGSYDLKPFEVRFGATNIFDKQYARHLSRSNLFDPDEVQVNEPGRSFYISLHARF